ncbi:Ferritin-like superfamily [Phytophthora cactorum]|nr:Ferritin-like superfamily [Phytophthora cactorum]
MNAELTAPALQEGDWLDVVDDDGIWNVAQVLRLPTPETVEVTYDCWGDEYNEELRRDSERIAPFQTHTWAVKCWAKLDTWPWWPALLTVRAPGSAQGSQNLRLEGRLLVDFLDKVEFKERCRCWVEKHKVVAFQSDEEAREILTKLKKKKNKSRGGVRLKNLALSTELLAMCDAREDFPEFVEGTLPVQFQDKFTRPTAEVRKEKGEEIWMRGFADNRVNHASTHAYIPVFPDESRFDSGKGTTSVEKTGLSTTRAHDTSHYLDKSSFSPDAGKGEIPNTSKVSKNAKDPATAPENNETTTQNPTNSRKRARPHDEDETSGSSDPSRPGNAKVPRKQTQENESSTKETKTADSTDTSRAGKAKAPRKQSLEDESNTKETHAAKATGNSIPDKEKPKTGTKELRVSPRKYGKTPKVLRSTRKSTAKLPPYTPPYSRVLLKAKPRNEQNAHRTPPTSHARHAPRAEKDRSLPATDRSVQQISAAATSSKSIADDDTASPMTNLARLTKATVRADAKLHDMETALWVSSLNSPRSLPRLKRCGTSALPYKLECDLQRLHLNSNRASSRDFACKRNRAPSSTLVPASEARRARRCRVPTLARRSSQAKCSIRGLELVLDDIISKDLNQSLSAATTPAELDAIKAELLKSPEVQAAIARIQNPSYATVTQDLYCVSGLLPREASSLSGDNSRRAWEKAKSRFNKYASEGHHLGLQANSLPDCGAITAKPSARRPPADQSSFGFSVNDNFSMNQWYRDLYPKTFDSTTPTLFACALDVLTTGDAFAKADKTTKYVAQWKSGEIKTICNEEDDLNNVPDHPARPENVEVVPAHKAKQGSRKAFVHSLVHAESYAIDLMWDIVARFVPHNLPRAFYDDWVRVAGEEAEHFNSWAHRLTELGSFYGDLAGHEGLWDAAYETRESILARLAVVHLVHEARGLDVFPNAVKRFEKASDDVSLKIIHKNYNEETTHVGAGVRWFRYVCERDGNDPIAKFHEIVPQYYKGTLKPPFNKEARDKADMLEEWYLPLSTQALAATDKHSAGAATVEETTAAISSMKLDAASS